MVSWEHHRKEISEAAKFSCPSENFILFDMTLILVLENFG